MLAINCPGPGSDIIVCRRDNERNKIVFGIAGFQIPSPSKDESRLNNNVSINNSDSVITCRYVSRCPLIHSLLLM